jgi:hypothetical protein
MKTLCAAARARSPPAGLAPARRTKRWPSISKWRVVGVMEPAGIVRATDGVRAGLRVGIASAERGSDEEEDG